MKKFIEYFVHRPVVVNALMFGLLITAFVTWDRIGKEEMPDFTLNFISVNVVYPGATAQDVELFITKPIEEELKGISDIDEVNSSSSYGRSSISIIFEANVENLTEKIQDVKDAVDAVQLPSEAEEPTFFRFRSKEKAIIDVGIYLEGKEILSVNERFKLQEYALAFMNKIISEQKISGTESNGYLAPELQVKVDPESLVANEISMGQVRSAIETQHIRNPIGNMRDHLESEVTLVSELDDIAPLKEVTVSAGFQGQMLKLKEVADVSYGFEDTTSVLKIQGHEGIRVSIKKSSSADILSAVEAVVEFIEKFKRDNDVEELKFVLIDDESYDVRNRLELIGSNGLVGFVLILIILFLFLDFKSGIWVAMGIPFSLGFTLIMCHLIGYTVNNMTLAAIIIVLGIVVDDAIIIAENISREVDDPQGKSGVQAVLDVIGPVTASVLTTCAAFVPLLFFSGRFSLFVKYIPPVIFLMLLASMIESFFLLPAHMIHKMKIEYFIEKKGWGKGLQKFREHFIHVVEDKYALLLNKLLKGRVLIILLFSLLLGGSFYIFKSKMRYVMFPREESRDFNIQVIGDPSMKRFETAKKVRAIEDIFLNDKRGIVTAVYTRIGMNRRGGAVKENEASVRVEIVPATERKESINQLLSDWEKKAKAVEGFKDVRFMKSRFGSDSGSSLAIQVQENNDERRAQAVKDLVAKLESDGQIVDIEIEKPVQKNEFRLTINKAETSRLNVSYSQLASTLRAYIEGSILYTLNKGEEEVDVRLTGRTENKDSLEKILNLTVGNEDGYLVPIRQLVDVEEGNKDANIQRVNFKRTTLVYASIKRGLLITPLEMAQKIEERFFPEILKGKPTTHLNFVGEVKDSRESQSDFSVSILMVVGLIYLLLIFLYDSFWTPLLIGAIIPFGVVGSVLAFYFHGMQQYGFFSVVGTLGMIGVVINDSIVLIDKLNEKITSRDNMLYQIAKVSSTRLRAIFITTFTTVAGLFPTAYGVGGYDSMLAEMMLAMCWGLLFGMFITLILVPCIYSFYAGIKLKGADS